MEIEDYLEEEEIVEQMRQKEWDRKYGTPIQKTIVSQNTNRRISTSSSSNDETPSNNYNNSSINNKDQRKYEGEPHHSNDRNYNRSGKFHKNSIPIRCVIKWIKKMYTINSIYLTAV